MNEFGTGFGPAPGLPWSESEPLECGQPPTRPLLVHLVRQQGRTKPLTDSFIAALRQHLPSVQDALGTRLPCTYYAGGQEAAKVRTWRTDRLVGGVGRSIVAKTYRILHAVFATAVDDDLVRRNPCRIIGAGSDHAEERPIATLDQVFAIARATQPRYRLMVLLATFAQLRFGELVALRRSSIDLDAMELRVPWWTGRGSIRTAFTQLKALLS